MAWSKRSSNGLNLPTARTADFVGHRGSGSVGGDEDEEDRIGEKVASHRGEHVKQRLRFEQCLGTDS